MSDTTIAPFLSPIPPLRVTTPPEDSDATQAARDFEAMFLAQSFEQSFKTLPDTAFGGGHAGETWRHFLARAIADEVAQGGGTGIAQWLAPQIAADAEGAKE